MNPLEPTRSHLFGPSLDLRIGTGIYKKLTRFTAMQFAQKIFFHSSNYIFSGLSTKTSSSRLKIGKPLVQNLYVYGTTTKMAPCLKAAQWCDAMPKT